MADTIKQQIGIQLNVSGDTNVVKALNDISKAQIKLNKEALKDKGTRALKDLKIELNAYGVSVKKVSGWERLRKQTLEGSASALKILKHETRATIAAQVGLNKSTKKSVFWTRNLRNANKEGAVAFSVFRSKLLLAAFAINLYARSIGKFLKLASDLEQQVSQFNIVFGESREESMAFAKALADDVGRSVSSIIPLMAQLQDTFVPLGFARDKAAKLSEAMAQLAIDVESFKDIPMEEVAKSFTSAIVGNHEAVRRLGIVLTEASVKQEAYRMGIAEVDSELSSQQKVIARTSIILLGTKDAWGNAKLTADEFANVLRQFTDQWKDIALAVGDFIKPLVAMTLQGLKPGTRALKFYAAALLIVGARLAWVNRKILLTRVNLIKTGYGIAVIAIGEYLSWLDQQDQALEESGNNLKDYQAIQEELALLLDTEATARETALAKANEYRESIEDLTASYQNQLIIAKEVTELDKELMKVSIDLEKSIKELPDTLKEAITAWFDYKKALKEIIAVQKAQGNISSAVVDDHKRLESLLANTLAANKEMIESDIELLETQVGLDRTTEKYTQALNDQKIALENVNEAIKNYGISAGDAGLDTTELIDGTTEFYNQLQSIGDNYFQGRLSAWADYNNSVMEINVQDARETRRFKNAQRRGDQKEMDRITKEAKNKNYADRVSQFRADQALAISNIIISYLIASAKGFAKYDPIFGFSFAAAMQGLSALQVGLVMAQPPPKKFAQGGDFIVPPGYPNDTFPMRVESGERVQITPKSGVGGVTPSQSTVNISFAGNVLSQDFIEDEAIPMIKEAIRRGADIGVA